jgi:VWFA-related protein
MRIGIVVLSIIGFGLCAQSCGSGSMFGKGEPAAQQDATPPPTHDPIFLKRNAPLPAPNAIEAITAKKPRLEIERIECSQVGKVKLIVQLIDTTGEFLTGASTAAWKSKWSDLSDRLLDITGADSDTKHVKKFTVREVTENERVPIALAIVMDHSGSMGETRAHAIQDGAEIVIDKKKPEDAFALVKYDNHVSVEYPLTKDPARLHEKLKKNGLDGFGNTTAIVDAALRSTWLLMDAVGYDRKAVLLFTDGLDNSSQFTMDTLLKVARGTNVLLCTVGFGDGVDTAYLQNIASNSGGSYHHIYLTNEIPDILEDVYRRIKNYYVIEYETDRYGVHDVDLSFNISKALKLTAHGTYDNTLRLGSYALIDVQFDLDKSDIKPESMGSIENVATLMKAFPKLSIEVRGHTDSLNNTGDASYNQKLSERRAQAVRQAIVQRGINGKRIRAVGFGDTHPVGDNNTEEGRTANRRTEFVIVGVN